MRALVLSAFVLVTAGEGAWAHGTADWINRGGFKSATGELCCGVHDCTKLADGDVGETEGGYYMRSRQDIVPYANALHVSPDGYWICVRPDGTLRCFLAPAKGS